MRYKIVLGPHIDEHVNDMLAEGWELYGYPFEIGKGDAIAQAMVLNVGNPDFKSDPPGLKRVEIQDPVVGFCYMRVCAIVDATDAEILAVCNVRNPSGTAHGWTEVVRVADTPQSPVPCEKHENRIHLIVGC